MANLPPPTYNTSTSIEVRLSGFNINQRMLLVASPHVDADRFQVEFLTPRDVAFHFNPRFSENCIVCNSTKWGQWQEEKRIIFTNGFPFTKGQHFTLEMIEQAGVVEVRLNKNHLANFTFGQSPDAITHLKISGLDIRFCEMYSSGRY